MQEDGPKTVEGLLFALIFDLLPEEDKELIRAEMSKVDTAARSKAKVQLNGPTERL